MAELYPSLGAVTVCTSQPPEVDNTTNQYYPALYKNQTAVGEYISYECHQGLEWGSGPSQRALCLENNTWALEHSDAKCVVRDGKL